MTDRELLELAAKAAGYEKYYLEHMGRKSFVTIHERFFNEEWLQSGTSISTMDWNPLTDDGDALRLAVKLNIPVFPYEEETSTGTIGVVAKNWGSKEANTRRAIVRAAAEIAKQMGDGDD